MTTRLQAAIHRAVRPLGSGAVTATRGALIAARLPQVAVGETCFISRSDGTSPLLCEAVAFNGSEVLLAPFDTARGIAPGAAVAATGRSLRLTVDGPLLGSVFDCLGTRLNRQPQVRTSERHLIPMRREPPPALSRKPVDIPCATGVRVIDACATLGYGQRIGLFAEAGVGKSTLLGMIARGCDADAVVIALVGERGREVGEFVDEELGEDGLRRSVVVAATSDEPPMRRLLALEAATSIAEYLREHGARVLLLVDSLTRAARAIRDIALAAGEIPVRQGYTPSVYSQLPRLIERAGRCANGSITAVYTVLTTDERASADPLAEELKSLLDGHLALSRESAERGLFPAVDPLRSISRRYTALNPPELQGAVRTMLSRLSRARRDRDLLLFGAEPDAELERALGTERAFELEFNQDKRHLSSLEEARLAVRRTLDAHPPG